MFGWSHLDREIHGLLTWLVKQYPDPAHESILGSDSLKRRIVLLKKLLRTRFATEPQVLIYLIGLVTDFKQAQSKRNILVHGRLRFRVSVKGPGTLSSHAIATKGRFNGTTQLVEFSINDLEDLRYEVASLTGRVRDVLAAGFPPDIDPDEVLRVKHYLSQHPPPDDPNRGVSLEESGVRFSAVPVRIDPSTGAEHSAPLHPDMKMPTFTFSGEFVAKNNT